MAVEVSQPQTGGICTEGDPLADSAVDGVWDIEGGRFALQEDSDALLHMIKVCAEFLDRQMVTQAVAYSGGMSGDKKGSDGTVEARESPEYPNVDHRIQLFINNYSVLPYYTSANRIRRGSSLLMEHILLVLHGLVCGTAVQIVCTSEGSALIAALVASGNYSDDYALPSSGLSHGNTTGDGDSLRDAVKMTDRQVYFYLYRMVRLLYSLFVSISVDGVSTKCDAHSNMVEFRLQLAVLRRLVLSVSGPGWWDESLWGMPLNSHFLLFCLRAMTVSCVESLESVSGLKGLTQEDKNDIVHLWYEFTVFL